MEQNEHLRIKVNKGVDKRIVILNLRTNYLGIFAIFFLLGGVILISSFSVKTLGVVMMFLIVIYLVMQYLDTIDFLENRKKSKVPKELYNDLY